MKRPRVWIRAVLSLCLLLATAEYVTLTHLAPRYVLWAVQYAAGGEIIARRARLSFPLTTTLSGVHLVNNTPQSALTIQRTVIRPRWFSAPLKTLWLNSVEIDRPALRLTQTRAGTILWPNLPEAVTTGLVLPMRWPSVTGAKPLPSSWRIDIDALKVVDGVIELVDERPDTRFHGMLDHLSVIAGPVTIPFSRSRQLSFAARGELVGDQGHAAPVYCSGWMDLQQRDLQASCKLEPLALAAFAPYYHGPPEIRVYTITLTSTSQWSAQSNELHGRIQLELDHLSEGDLSIRGRTIVDVKRITSGPDPRLKAEISLTGPLDHPHQWQAEFLPGDDHVQHLVTRLLEHRIGMVTIPLWWGDELRVRIVSANRTMMTDIEAMSKEIKDALEVLALPVVEEAPPAAAAPAGEPAAVPPAIPAIPEQGVAMPPTPALPQPAAPQEPQAPVSPEPTNLPAK